MKYRICAGLFSGLLGLSAIAAEPASFRGDLLVDPMGLTLYTFAVDKPNVSHCNVGCTPVWPPLLASSDAVPQGLFTLVKRNDGTRQWAFRGHPLYRFVGDRKRGDVGGENVALVWHTVRVETLAGTTPQPEGSVR